MQIILAILSFFGGFFIKKQSSDLKATKKEVKKYEEMQQSQQEIIARNILNNISGDPVLQFKKNRDKHKSSK